jgi:hypothetical protein
MHTLTYMMLLGLKEGSSWKRHLLQSLHLLLSFLQQHQQTSSQMLAILTQCLGKLLSYHVPFGGTN